MSTPVRMVLVSPALAVGRALSRALDAEAHVVVIGEASTSAQALVRGPGLRPDVVLAGSLLRDPDAPEMCPLLRAAVPDLHVLLVGVNATEELVEAAIRAGASGMVRRTADEDELVEAIETAAARRLVMSTKSMMSILQAERDPAASDPLARLTPLERELFELVGQGLSNAEIAERLRLAPGTVRNYVSRLLRKLDVDRRAQVVAIAARRGSAGGSPAGPAVPAPRRGSGR